MKGYEDNLGEPLRKVKEDVEREWAVRLEKEVKLREEKDEWADELVKQLDKEKKVRLLSTFLLSYDTDAVCFCCDHVASHEVGRRTRSIGCIRQEVRFHRFRNQPPSNEAQPSHAHTWRCGSCLRRAPTQPGERARICATNDHAGGS